MKKKSNITRTETPRPTLADNERWLAQMKREGAPIHDSAALRHWLKGYCAALKSESRAWRAKARADRAPSVAIEAFASAFAPDKG